MLGAPIVILANIFVSADDMAERKQRHGPRNSFFA